MRTPVLLFAAALPLLAVPAATAAPIEYVRVCDTFGTSFFYIPGTDTCVNADTGETETQTVNGRVTGTTKSQQDAIDAQNDATNAQETADEAQSTADKAQSTADKAQSSANDAQKTANEALDAANGSGAMAGHAMSAAEQAQIRADQAVDGAAISLAMQPAMVTEGHTYGLALNAGTFDGSTAVAVSGAFALNDNVTFNGALGAALGSGQVAGRGGVNISW